MSGEKRDNERTESVSTGGGAYVRGDVSTGGGDFVGRDLTIGQKIVNVFTGSTAEQRAQRNRGAMLTLVHNFWVKGVLEQSLHGAAMIELGMEERVEAVERPWDMVLQMPDRPNRELSRGTKIVDVFDEMNRALLILGDPGSGKTTMLLELARDTIARAERDPTLPIPVVFNLSSWAGKRQSIAEWLVEELNAKYNIPKRIARPWVENDDLLLLLDGLDEVKLEHREGCVKAINDFRQEHGLTPLVVCSRIADYEALATRLKLQGAVLLQSLTPQQIDQYLEGAGAELVAVRETLQDDPTLQEMTRSPLMLSIMALAYRGMQVEDLQALGATEDRRRHVFDAYVRRMFERRGTDQPYTPEQTVRWLTWLAQKMTRHAQTVFLIEWMQLSWLQTRAQRRRAGLLVGLVVGLPFWLVFGLFLWLVVGLVVGLVAGLLGRQRVEPIGVSKWLWEEARNGLLAGLFVGLPFWLVIGLTDGLFVGLISWLFVGLLIGLPVGLLGGGVAVTRHFALRFVLYRNGYIPWNLVRFLDYATERIFLRKVGDDYIFVHRLLQDYFASLAEE